MVGYKIYEELICDVYKGFVFLVVVILIEVGILFLGKGYFGVDVSDYSWILVIIVIGLIVLLFYKVYFIIYEFMYMCYEVKGLVMSVLLLIFLLVWVVIVFF